MPATPPSDHDRPATRRELYKEREVMEANSRAEFARVRQEMAEGFAALRKEMAEGFAALRKEMAEAVAAVRAEMATKEDIRSLRRELRLQWAVSLATLAAVLRLSV